LYTPGDRSERFHRLSEQIGFAEHAVHGALAGGDDVLVEHHVAQLSVTGLGMAQSAVLDGRYFVGQQPVVAGWRSGQVIQLQGLGRGFLRNGPPAIPRPGLTLCLQQTSDSVTPGC